MTALIQNVKAHFECAEASAGLVDTITGLTTIEQGTVGSVSDGALGLARGPCSGTFPAGPGFTTPVVASGPFDYNTGSFSESGWVRVSSTTAGNEFTAQDGPSNAETVYLFRCVMDLGGGNFSPAIILWTGASFGIGHASTLGQGSQPTGEWFYVGWGWDRPSETLACWETSSRGSFYETLSTSGSTVFSYTVEDLSIGQTRGSSFTGVNGDIDQIDFFNKLLSPSEAAFLGSSPKALSQYNSTSGLLLIG